MIPRRRVEGGRIGSVAPPSPQSVRSIVQPRLRRRFRCRAGILWRVHINRGITKTLDRVLQQWRIRKAKPFVRPGSHLLDVGCADGVLLRRLGSLVDFGVGIDPDAVPSENNRFRLVRGAFPDDIAGEEQFDTITALAVLEHIPQAAQSFFAESCFRLLKPGGNVVITVPDPAVDRIIDILVRLRLLDGMSVEEHWGFVPAQADALFHAAGFSKVAGKRFQLGLNNLLVFGRPRHVQGSSAVSDPSTSGEVVELAEGIPDVSVVLPCLNEAASVGTVIQDALRVMEEASIKGEVVVSDNSSDDASAELARAAGAKVVFAAARGYGNAYHAGMAAARGRVLVMADADGTYPMESIPDLVGPVLRGEKDMVIGSRLRGEIKGMPWLHRYVGNPVLTGTLNRFSGIRVSDAHSGMRAIDADVYHSLGLVTPGMEYASEMIVQAARAKLRLGEVPIEYRIRVGESKLETWPDGWRHLKYLLLSSPTWLFLIPGAVASVFGLLLVIPLTFGPVAIGPVRLILHPMILGAVLTITGYVMLEFGVLVRACSVLPAGVTDRLADFVHRRLTLERVLLGGGLVLLAGLGLGVAIFIRWAASGFGELAEIRVGILAMTLFVLGAQTIFGGFLYAFFLPAQFGGGVARPQ